MKECLIVPHELATKTTSPGAEQQAEPWHACLLVCARHRVRE